MIIQEKDIQECWKQSLVVFPAFVRLLQGKKALHCPNGHSWQEINTLVDALQWLSIYDGQANTLVLKTGKVSDITVIDDDMRTCINPDLERLVPVGTPTAVTGNNGHHFFFQYDATTPTASYKRACIDLRNDGGLIFLPPSCIEGRTYSWIVPLTRDALRPMPDALRAPIASLREPCGRMREPGTKTYAMLSTKQRYYLDRYLDRCNRAKKGKHDRSACDFALCSWAIKCSLSPESLWQLVRGVGKFAEESHGRNYFDRTYKNALGTE